MIKAYARLLCKPESRPRLLCKPESRPLRDSFYWRSAVPLVFFPSLARFASGCSLTSVECISASSAKREGESFWWRFAFVMSACLLSLQHGAECLWSSASWVIELPRNSRPEAILYSRGNHSPDRFSLNIKYIARKMYTFTLLSYRLGESFSILFSRYFSRYHAIVSGNCCIIILTSVALHCYCRLVNPR